MCDSVQPKIRSNHWTGYSRVGMLFESRLFFIVVFETVQNIQQTLRKHKIRCIKFTINVATVDKFGEFNTELTCRRQSIR